MRLAGADGPSPLVMLDMMILCSIGLFLLVTVVVTLYNCLEADMVARWQRMSGQQESLPLYREPTAVEMEREGRQGSDACERLVPSSSRRNDRLFRAYLRFV